MLKIININDKDLWQSYVEQCDSYDFYHTWEYHKISEENKEGEPELIVLEEDDFLICLPLLKREITSSSKELLGYDYTSAYGYLGPIYTGELKPQSIEEFKKSFLDYCVSNKIVSVFSRLHPIINQSFLLDGMALVEDNSTTINIDLTQTLAEQRKHYRKSNKSEVNKLRKTCQIVWSDNSSSDVDEFISIYEETMKRVDAKDYYFFTKKYYMSLINSKDFETKLVFVEKEGVKIAAALFIFCNDIIQYHLAGTRTEYIRETPMKLLLDEIRLIGTEKGYKSFHLGGGTTSSTEDSLFRFKRGFSKVECKFKTLKFIPDQSLYDKIVTELSVDLSNVNKDFFPLYRA
jgi:hypothetical protein